MKRGSLPGRVSRLEAAEKCPCCHGSGTRVEWVDEGDPPEPAEPDRCPACGLRFKVIRIGWQMEVSSACR